MVKNIQLRLDNQGQEISVLLFTISIHNWLQVLVLGDDIGDFTNCEISVFILLNNQNREKRIS